MNKILGLNSNILKITTILLVLILAACSGPERDVLGKWKSEDGLSTIEFFHEGTVTMMDEIMPVSGSYTFLEKDRIKLDMGGIGALFGPLVSEIVISKNKNKMIIVYPSPLGAVRYNRVQ